MTTYMSRPCQMYYSYSL